MKNIVVITALFFCYQPLFAQEQTLRQLTSQYGIPGIQLVCIKGNKEQSFNIGTISKSSDKKVTSKTIFEAASLSKCVHRVTEANNHIWWGLGIGLQENETGKWAWQ
jgi:Beta-lactamase